MKTDSGGTITEQFNEKINEYRERTGKSYSDALVFVMKRFTKLHEAYLKEQNEPSPEEWKELYKWQRRINRWNKK